MRSLCIKPGYQFKLDINDSEVFAFEDNEKIEEILEIPWEKDKDQLECVFSGNYRLCDGSVGPVLKDINRYFKEFAVPVSEKVVEEYLEGKTPDFMGVAQQVLD